MTSKPRQDTLPAVIARFTSRTRILIRTLAESFPDDATAMRAVARGRFACEHAPVVVIKNIGYYINKYSDQVLDRDLNFFIQTTYDTDLMESVTRDKIDFVQYLIPRVKESVVGLDHAAQMEFADLILDMFEDYLTYVELGGETF